MAEWDGAKATGGILFDSEKRQTVGSVLSYEVFTFDTGGLDLIAGREYVAFLSDSKFRDGVTDLASMGLETRFVLDPYPDGHFAFLDNGSDFGALFTTPWKVASFAPVVDVSFVANFTASPVDVPWPAAPLLLGSAVTMLGTTRCWRRRRRPLS